jgi:hypothetical protein
MMLIFFSDSFCRGPQGYDLSFPISVFFRDGVKVDDGTTTMSASLSLFPPRPTMEESSSSGSSFSSKACLFL